VIGLDIGTKFIKICQVEKQGSACRIAAAAIAANPGIQPDTSKPYAPVTSRIRAVLKDANISGRTVAAAVAGQNVVTRSFSFPALSR
jgi:Tfp pilus assembly PilM family ATPase